MAAKNDEIQELEFEHPVGEQESSSGYGALIVLIAFLGIVGVVVWLVVANQN